MLTFWHSLTFSSRRPPLPSNTTARTITRSRGAISNIFPGATLHAQQPSGSSLYARSPSPQLAVPLPRKHRTSTAPTPSPPAARVLRRPKKSRNFGDGTELDSIEDLAVEREKESKFRVAPTGRGNVGQKKQPATVTTGPTGTIGRRRGAAEATARSVSSASSQGAIGRFRATHDLVSGALLTYSLYRPTATPGSVIETPTTDRVSSYRSGGHHIRNTNVEEEKGYCFWNSDLSGCSEEAYPDQEPRWRG